MTVKRFVSWLRGDRSDRNRIRAMWEPEPWESRRSPDQLGLIVWMALLTIFVAVIGKTVL